MGDGGAVLFGVVWVAGDGAADVVLKNLFPSSNSALTLAKAAPINASVNKLI